MAIDIAPACISSERLTAVQARAARCRTDWTAQLQGKRAVALLELSRLVVDGRHHATRFTLAGDVALDCSCSSWRIAFASMLDASLMAPTSLTSSSPAALRSGRA